MLQIDVPEMEYFDDSTQEFFYRKKQTLFLEHSLISISKWESMYKKPFLDSSSKTTQETIDYIKCMTLNSNVDPIVYNGITDVMIREIEAYIEDPMTATRIMELGSKAKNRRQIITSELIYYWMIEFNIPFECQKWHLNRLMMLIRVCNEKRNPKKMTSREMAKTNTALNAARRTMHNSRG